MKSALKAFTLAADLSTQASPSTLRRWAMPSSRRFWSSMGGLCLALRQESDHGVGEGVRLFDIRNMRGVEDRQAGAGNPAADEFAVRDRRRHVVASGNHQRRTFDFRQELALIERAQRFAAGEIALDRR